MTRTLLELTNGMLVVIDMDNRIIILVINNNRIEFTSIFVGIHIIGELLLVNSLLL